jgi:hypothetical protein
LAARGDYLELHEGIVEGDVGPPQPKKHILPKWVYRKYKTQNIDTEPLKPNSLEKKIRWGINLHR